MGMDSSGRWMHGCMDAVGVKGERERVSTMGHHEQSESKSEWDDKTNAQLKERIRTDVAQIRQKASGRGGWMAWQEAGTDTKNYTKEKRECEDAEECDKEEARCGRSIIGGGMREAMAGR